MDQPSVGAETFVLKTNIHSYHCEKMMIKLLLDIKGVKRISMDAAEVGKITILGTIDPRKLIKILQENGINSDLVLKPMIDSKDLSDVVCRPKSRMGKNPIVDPEMMSQLHELSQIKTFKSVVAKSNGIKVIYKEDENVHHLDGESGPCSARNLHENAMHKHFYGDRVINNDCEFHGNHESCCSRKQGMYAPHETVSLGIPMARTIVPSAPPLPECYLDRPPSQEQSRLIKKEASTSTTDARDTGHDLASSENRRMLEIRDRIRKEEEAKLEEKIQKRLKDEQKELQGNKRTYRRLLSCFL